MSPITAWTRLEPRTRDTEFTDAAEATVHDPLWLLARQRQLGEWQGHDGGTPIEATVELTEHTYGTLRAAGSARDCSSGVPLEAAAHAEPNPPGPFDAAAAGSQFVQLLAAAGAWRLLPEFIAAHRLIAPDSTPAMALMARAVPDGRQLAEAFESRPHRSEAERAEIARGYGAQEAEVPAVAEAIDRYLHWYRRLFATDVTGSAWVDQRLGYDIALETAGGASDPRLISTDHRGGPLDWPDFDVERPATAAPAVRASQRALPTPVSFRGMPSARFWQRGDPAIQIGAIETGPTDLARLLVIDFALSYGNDFFLVPLVQPINSTAQIELITVTDTFGYRDRIAAAAGTHMFTLTPRRPEAGADAPGGALFAPANAVAALDGEAVEEVLFLRDEMANMAWAIERIAPGVDGRPARRDEPRAATSEPAAAPNDLSYRLMDTPPPWWYPLVPTQVAPGARAIRLQRWSATDPESETELRAATRILTPIDELTEETVPRGGARVTRIPRYARGADGSAHVWLGLHRSIGRGEGSSGLRYDQLSEPRQP